MVVASLGAVVVHSLYHTIYNTIVLYNRQNMVVVSLGAVVVHSPYHTIYNTIVLYNIILCKMLLTFSLELESKKQQGEERGF